MKWSINCTRTRRAVNLHSVLKSEATNLTTVRSSTWGVYYTGLPPPQPAKVLPSILFGPCSQSEPRPPAFRLKHQLHHNVCGPFPLFDVCRGVSCRLTFFKGLINPSLALHQSYYQDQLYQRSKGMRGRGLSLPPNQFQLRCSASLCISPTSACVSSKCVLIRRLKAALC